MFYNVCRLRYSLIVALVWSISSMKVNTESPALRGTNGKTTRGWQVEQWSHLNVTISGEERWSFSPAASAGKGAARRAASIAVVAMLGLVTMSRSPWSAAASLWCVCWHDHGWATTTPRRLRHGGWPGRAGAGGGGGGEDRPLAPPARVTTTPTPPLVQTRTGAHFIMVTSPHPADTRHYGQTKNQDTLFSRCVEMERGPQGHPNSCQGWLRVVCVVMLWYDLGRDFYWCHQTIYNEDTR